jgi:hypothetical protein
LNKTNVVSANRHFRKESKNMLKNLKKLWNDESGAIIASEIVLIGTITVIGTVTGLTSLRDGVIEELADLGAAVGCIDQSFSCGNVCGHSASTSKSQFTNQAGFCEGGSSNSRCLVINDGCYACPIQGQDSNHN